MPIFVKKSYDPDTRSSREGAPCILASNAVSDELKRLVRRYVLEEVNGRSYLISGHRGSGKTTLIKKIVQDLGWEIPRENIPRRPLLVTLQGPMLLPSLDGKGTAAAVDETKEFLEQIAVNLYRVLAGYVADQYETFALGRLEAWTRHNAFLQARARELADWKDRLALPLTAPFRILRWINGRKPIPARIYEMQEIARDLRLKLDGPMDLLELREFWSTVGALDRGVLFPQMRGTGQGVNELVAIWSCLRAYLTLASNQYELTAKAAGQQETKAEAGIKTAEGKGILPTLAGLAGGSAVAAALQQATNNLAAAVLWGIASGIGSALVFSYTASRSRSSTASLESIIKMKRDMQTLARELPELLQRCRKAGLVPVFLVDELDKVEKLETRMDMLVRNTKFFVTEQALFFFATDRSYYECLHAGARQKAYPPAYTYFSDQLFVAYRPGDWRSYLKDRLEATDQDGDPSGTANNALQILIGALLCRSRMHAIDLQRHLSEVTESLVENRREDVESIIATTPAEMLKNTRFQLEVFMQCAVEVTLGTDANLTERCREDPAFTQITYDALYYLCHLWQEPAKAFILSKDILTDYLNGRSQPIFENDDDPDLEHLFLKAKRVSFWLRNPKQLAEEWEKTFNQAEWFSKAVVERIASAPPLLDETNGECRWRYDAFGRALSPVNLQEVRENDDLRHMRDLIRKVADGLKQNTEQQVDLDAMQRAGLVPSTPLVKDIFVALDRLDGLDRDGAEAYADMDEDVRLVRSFGYDLRQRGELIARTVAISWLLAHAANAQVGAKGFLDGWSCLAARLSSTDLHPQTLLSFVNNIHQALRARWNISEDGLKCVSLGQYEHETWTAALSSTVTAVQSIAGTAGPDRNEAVKSAWLGWADRIESRLRGAPISGAEIGDHTLDEMFCWVWNLGPGRWLVPNLNKVSLRGWSRELYLALTSAEGNLEVQVPMWLGVVALLMMGHASLAKQLMDTWQTEMKAEEWLSPPNLVRQLRTANRMPVATTPIVRTGQDPAANPKKGDAAPAGAPSPAHQLALIISASTESAVEAWLPSPKMAGFAFTADEVAILKKTRWTLPAKLAVVLIEINERETVEQMLSLTAPDVLSRYNLLNFYDEENTQVGVLVKTPVTEEGTQVRFLYQCTSFDDAISRLSMRLPSPSPPRSPL